MQGICDIFKSFNDIISKIYNLKTSSDNSPTTIILLNVDCVIPLIVASLLTVIIFSLQSSSILNFVASPIFKFITLKLF